MLPPKGLEDPGCHMFVNPVLSMRLASSCLLSCVGGAPEGLGSNAAPMNVCTNPVRANTEGVS